MSSQTETKKERKGITLLSKGLFEKPLLDTRIRTHGVSKKEKYLGHLIGPLGMIFVINTVAALVEKFFTQQVGAMYGTDNYDMSASMGNTYQLIMTIAKFVSVAIGVINSWLISHTKSKQGRMRPWYLIFGFISIIICGCIFLFPGNTLGNNYWYFFFTMLICYSTVGSSFFYLFRDNIVSLSTHNAKEKEQLVFIRKLSWTLISGILIGMLVSSVVIPYWLENDINGYAILMVILSIIAIPLLLMEYYYTRERCTEDADLLSESGNSNKVSIKDQFKALFKNKCWVLLTILALASQVIDTFKGGNVQYFYVKYLLNGEAHTWMYMVFQVVTGSAVGIGAFAIQPLAKKFGVRNVSLVGYIMAAFGSALGWIFPDSIAVAFIGGFIRNVGWMPNSYIFSALICYAFDSIEYKSGKRMEGLFVTGCIAQLGVLISAPFAGFFEANLLRLGFSDVAGYVPDSKVKAFLALSFYGFDLAYALLVCALLPFVDVEKHLPEISKELLRRKKEAVLASGKEWIEPKEEDRLENIRAEEEFESNRLLDLHEKCDKKGLDFEVENAKYFENKKKKEELKAKFFNIFKKKNKKVDENQIDNK